ncbi:rifampin ADP-ribosyl transferase [Exiguobacterium sibiricum 255-15]|uniref:Rifampin ADP-ribosyl transferase n=1 Tax=Exiguobacterium sibiricum (strain DSM 17290 / CCUG 55495 / CIP 109462 / JCM 13490 / 255-15) TaxID=262543 RepID=B1YFG4_EXIS2|nr:NAD(+)--rifampin ADP-ribosyltransferase [Exiguobacterium sibiricum]ACB60840.1 rifampin ADP-ribosyl transferase [Exiguobacterium sibiricum 255-15]
MTGQIKVLDQGPFLHGTKAVLQVGDQLTPDYQSNYQEKRSNYIYFTATLEAAKWGAELAKGDGMERIYLVEPLGTFENDPNLTDQRFPGNPTRSYRSKEPLLIVAKLAVWERHSNEMIQQMKDSLARLAKEGKNVILD